MATEDKKGDGRTVLLKNVRLSFTDSLLHKKKTADDGAEKHSCNVIVPSDRPEFEANKAKVMSAIRAAGEAAWKKPEAWKDIAEESPKRVCFRKGERFKNKEGEVYQGYAGHYGITASGPRAGQQRPKLLDKYKRPVEEKDILDVFYGGVDADVYVSFFGTDKGSRGIFASIELIRSRQTGERMGGGAPDLDLDELDDLGDDDSDLMTAGGGSSDDDLL